MDKENSKITTTTNKKKKTNNNLGRPSSYTIEKGKKIIESLESGKSLRQTCRDLKAKDKKNPSAPQVIQWTKINKSFHKQYVRACEIRDETQFEELEEMASLATNENAQAVKLQVDTRKWILARRNPRLYGDRQTVEHQGNQGLHVMLHRPENTNKKELIEALEIEDN